MQFVTTPGVNAGKLLLDWGAFAGTKYLWTWQYGSSLQLVTEGFSVGNYIAQSPVGDDFVSTDNNRWLMDFATGGNDAPLATLVPFAYQYLSSSSQWDSWSGISQSFPDLTDSGMVMATTGQWAGNLVYIADPGNDVVRAIKIYPPGTRHSSRYGGSNASQLCWRCLLGEPVGADQGDLVESATDLAVATREPDPSVSRCKTSAASANDGPLGYGWSGSLAMSAVQDTGGDWTINQENGATVSFYPSGSGSSTTYSTTADTLGTLVDSNPGGSTGTLTFTRKATGIFTFDKATGHELTASDLNGEALTFSYTSGQLSTVTDARSGRSLTFAWTGTHVTSVTDNIGRTVTYGYTDGHGNLNTVTDVPRAKPPPTPTTASTSSPRSKTPAATSSPTTTTTPAARSIGKKTPPATSPASRPPTPTP